MKKLTILLCIITFMGTLAAQAECPCKTAPTADEQSCETPAPSCEDQKPCHWRLTQTELYKKLCLNQCQIDKASSLYNKYKCETKEIRESLKCEKAKLCEMVKGCANKCEIKTQKMKVKNLRNNLKEKWACHDEQLKEILTLQQFKEYKAIKKEEKARYKRFKKHNCCK